MKNKIQWTGWVIALIILALFIVAGYQDVGKINDLNSQLKTAKEQTKSLQQQIDNQASTNNLAVTKAQAEVSITKQAEMTFTVLASFIVGYVWGNSKNCKRCC